MRPQLFQMEQFQSVAALRLPFQNPGGARSRFPLPVASQAVTVYPEQPGEIMIEVDEVESDARVSLA